MIIPSGCRWLLKIDSRRTGLATRLYQWPITMTGSENPMTGAISHSSARKTSVVLSSAIQRYAVVCAGAQLRRGAHVATARSAHHRRRGGEWRKGAPSAHCEASAAVVPSHSLDCHPTGAEPEWHAPGSSGTVRSCRPSALRSCWGGALDPDGPVRLFRTEDVSVLTLSELMRSIMYAQR